MPISKLSISAKLLIAFLAMGAIIALQGLYGYSVMSRAGAMVVDIFDHPMMAINYARAANYDFALMEHQAAMRDRATPTKRAAIDSEIDTLTASFNSDLRVAQERSTELDELREIESIKPMVVLWTAARHAGDATTMNKLGVKICAALDMLIELNTDHGYIGRRQAVAAIAEFRYVLVGGLTLSLVLALLITLFLTRQIARPLSQAASVADRIAAGEFETPIPEGGADETGLLLHSMTVMQANIREMVEREKARAVSAESRLADALETSDEGVMLVGADDRLVMVNSRLRDFFPSGGDRMVPGASFAQLVEDFLTLFPNQRARARAAARRSIAGEHRLPDGRWVRVSVSPTSDGGKIVFVSDFTAFKQREESFKQAKHEAEAASAAKSRFLANMSHELRTPLNAIIGFSEIIASQMLGKIDSPRYVEYAGDILHSGRHLLDVINSVLDLSKSEAGKLSLRTDDVDLREVLQDCAKMVGEQCVSAGLVLKVSGLEQPLPIHGEMAKLRQIFLNLLSNAIKFTERRGSISLSVVQCDDEIAISVSDTGIGMSEKEVQIALTAFGQVDNRLERKYDGTGLGLPLAKSFVELHGGSLRVESAVGRGTTVTVRLKTHQAAMPNLAYG